MLLSALMVWFNDRVLPETNHRLAELMMDINSKSPTLTMKDRGVLNEIPTVDYTMHYWLKANRIDPRHQPADGCRDIRRQPSGCFPDHGADSGQMVFNRDRTNLFLTLYDGRVDQIKRQTPKDIERVFFKEQPVQLKFANGFT